MEFTTIHHLLGHPPDPVGSLWGESLLPCKGLTLLHSGSKMGKSMLSLNLALAGARGDDEFLGHKLNGPFSTLILQSEIHLRGIYERAFTMAAEAGFTEEQLNRVLVNVERTARLSDDNTFIEFQKLVRHYRPDFIILDPLAHVLTTNENDNAVVGAMLERLALLRDDPGCAILLIHHDAKVSEATAMRSPQQRARGADRLNADPDCILSLVPGPRLATGPSGKLHVASRYGKSVAPFSVRLNEANLWFETHVERGDTAWIAQWVSNAGGQCEADVLIAAIEAEWGLHDKQHRTAGKYIMHAMSEGCLYEKAPGVLALKKES